jgi:signal transduction histidine kinase/DNA-binding response OmpR family regulator/CHASE3 domain sensor protein/HAMP domain-containing protein
MNTSVKTRPRLLRNLQIGFGLSLLLLIITSVASYSSIHNLLDASKWVDHTDSVIQATNNVLSTLKDAETGQRGFLLTGDTVYLRPYYGSQDRALAQIDEVQLMTRDNAAQQENIKELRDLVEHRLGILQGMIDMKRAQDIYSLPDLQKGREYMEEVRYIIQRMQDEEHRLLAVRVAKVRTYSTYTPALIIAASLLAIILTLVFYGRVYRDFLERQSLLAELQQKDADISRRIEIISNIADQISAGQYKTRVTDAQKDNLGDLAGSLNKMAESLDYSFGLLSDKEWLQTGIAKLNDEMVGETDMKALVNNVLSTVVGYTGCVAGALYTLDPVTGALFLGAGHALGAGARNTVRLGEGLPGQVAEDGKMRVMRDIPEGDWVVSFASGNLRPRSVTVFPFFHEKKVRGVIELCALHEFGDRELEYFTSIGDNIGTAVQSIESRLRLQELLEETQAQTEELQSQHSELESLNLELEVQAEKLQVSEEELKVQQEELLQTNQELEERSRTLEEKNQLILVRNRDIQRKAEELALTTKYKSEFMANMSHELRTPLNSILLLSRLLVENGSKNLSDEQTEFARVIQNSGQGLLQLIDEILDLSRIESGKLQLEYAMLSMTVVLDDMRMLFGPIAKDKNLHLHVIVEEGAPSQLETDMMRLEQILKNLLSNAFKFTEKGGVTLVARASATHANHVEFVVRDTGIGIPGDKHNLIFEAFQQADGSTRRKYGGTGLGLSISRELARLLGGEITLTSKPDEGAEFAVDIPIFKIDAEAELAPVAAPETRHEPVTTLNEEHRGLFTLSSVPEEIPDDRGEVSADDKVLLIVEDDTFFAQGLLDFTRKKGYKGIVAVSGDTAIRMARQYKPMGILLDIQLPVKNGWEVMDELKRDPQTRAIPVHIISSFEVKNESLLRGAVDFMSKPVAIENMDKVFLKIEYFLKRHAQKVIIVEDDNRHARALGYFLSSHHLRMEIASTVDAVPGVLQKEELNGVILSPGTGRVDALETIRKNPAFENIPIILFTGNSISKTEEARLRRYADSIVVKTAHSYQRILDEVSLFLHIVGEVQEKEYPNAMGRLGALDEVLKDKTVLVADDDVRNIFSLTKALEQHKMKVVTAMDGKEALAVAEGNGVDIVLMDMMMPEMDGFEAITRIRRHSQLRHLPIIAVTAKAMTGDRERCIQAGASDYISKPVDVDQLLSLLRIWLYEK